MKRIGKVLAYLILAVNALLVGILILTAYSPYLSPVVYPVQSCMGLAFPIFLLANCFFLLFWLIVHYRFALLPLLGLACCYPQIRAYLPIHFRTTEIPKEHIKILSYNIMSFDNLKKEDGKNPVLEYVCKSDADIVCLQEHNIPSNSKKYLNAKEVEERMKVYPYRHIQRVGGVNGSNQIAVYSKYPILSARKIAYESSYNGSAIYELKIGKDTLTLINNHLESNKLTQEDKVVYEEMLKDPDAHKVKSGARHLIGKLAEASAIRAKQADAIASEIAATRHPYVVVCGDFNDTAISYTHRTIGEHLDDAFTESGQGLGISYNQNRFYFRIDHILISKNLKAYNCTVDRSINGSDHYPIWCYVSKR